jgi:hypothetical protein
MRRARIPVWVKYILPMLQKGTGKDVCWDVANFVLVT